MIEKFNKKADSRLLSPYLFIILGIIGVGIVLGVWIFYSVEADVRFEGSKILANKLIPCIVEDNYLKEDITLENIVQDCSLDEDKFTPNGDYYFKININEEIIEKGNKDFEIQCILPGANLANCYLGEFIVLNKNKEVVKIKILAGSNQIGGKL